MRCVAKQRVQETCSICLGAVGGDVYPPYRRGVWCVLWPLVFVVWWNYVDRGIIGRLQRLWALGAQEPLGVTHQLALGPLALIDIILQLCWSALDPLDLLDIIFVVRVQLLHTLFGNMASDDRIGQSFHVWACFELRTAVCMYNAPRLPLHPGVVPLGVQGISHKRLHHVTHAMVPQLVEHDGVGDRRLNALGWGGFCPFGIHQTMKFRKVIVG